MWVKFAQIVLKYRILFILAIAAYTAFMGYHARRIEMTYDFNQVVPSDDEDMVYFQEFKRTFGEDGNMLAIGLQDSAVFELENFRRFKYFSDAVAGLNGINEVIALPRIGRIIKDQEKQQFSYEPLFKELPDTQQELDSLLAIAGQIKFYEGRVVNDSTGANLMIVSIGKEILNSPKRQQLMDDIMHLGREFTDKTNIKLHYAGLPFVRTVMATKVRGELNLFLVLSVCVTAVILMAFFRSWRAVVFPMLVILVVVVSTMGTVALLGYKITLLTALLPPIIVVIAIPNCIYMLNKYHQEYARHRDKMGALNYIIRKIGVVTLLTNATTAVGFVVLAFTEIAILKEFGIVAGINIVIAFVVSIILIPSVFAYLPAPNPKQLKHLEFKAVNKIISSIDLLVHRHPIFIYGVTGALIVISIIGMTRLKAISYMVDDLPEKSDIKQDLAFFEANFQGVMPLEIVIDTGNKRGAMNLQNLRVINEFEEFLAQQPSISSPVSLVSFAKASRQAFYNGSPAYYSLPTNQDKNFIMQYLRNQMQNGGENGMQANLLNSFVDSTGQKLRVSLKVEDMGSVKLDSLLNSVIRPAITRIFADTDFNVFVTGTTLLFIKGNDYLIENLQSSLVIAFVLISLIMAALFGNFRMIVISLIPNIIPLLVTAGLMGYFNIPLKPSTALIFSIAFGISVDDSIHFLAKYRQEVRQHNYFVPKAVSLSIFETGSSMFYTSIVLFAGFIIFAWSDFGGTVALGILTSTTLLFAMLTNLILLPRLLLTFDKKGSKDDFEPWIEHYEEFYTEEEDEEIDVDMITLKGTDKPKKDL